MSGTTHLLDDRHYLAGSGRSICADRLAPRRARYGAELVLSGLRQRSSTNCPSSTSLKAYGWLARGEDAEWLPITATSTSRPGC